MDQAVRNKLRNVVTQCRKVLEDATGQALQGRFGIYRARKKGEIQIEDETRMAHLSDEDRACRQDLLDHLAHIQAIGYKPSEALEQLTREIAFTHLNRLCAYKMMEARGLIREAVSRGLKSQGFFFYLADHPDEEKLHNNGQQEIAYRNFLDWLGGTLSEEIGALFNPNDPANRIYPPQRVLDDVLALINDGELKDIWSQDETIGWVYQYFTPKELRDKARKESQAPRNSYELAFRNQFFTPRYVVEFLTDNTLGRIWYEMRKGDTVLKDRCRYLVRRPAEIFLNEGEEPPAEAKETRDNLSQEELLKQPVYIQHRVKKDPREIKILDPACGSGHFLLYCFDLLQVIYEEAYDDPDLGAALRKDYPALEDLRRAVPGLILKHNLHGIDIDLRATQIAALALWLRCQRAFHELGINNGERPEITRSNIVCAEPMPGEEDMRWEFVQSLDDKLGQLVTRIFDRMKLAGEAGSLLKIEEEIGTAIREIYGQYGEMFRESDEQRWMKAEKDLLTALQVYTEQAENGRGFKRKLFAEDAEQGFAFVDVCRKKYDVVLMNPPFGLAPKALKGYITKNYPDTYVDLYASFVTRGLQYAYQGIVGAITSRAFLMTKKLSRWRKNELIDAISVILDLGSPVMDDAFVEACAFTAAATVPIPSIVGFDRRFLDEKETPTDIHTAGARNERVFCTLKKRIHSLPQAKLLYSLPPSIQTLLRSTEVFEPEIGTAREGMRTFDDFRFLRLRWEISATSVGHDSVWEPLSKGGEYALYYSDIHLLVKWNRDGAELAEVNREVNGQTAQSRQASEWWRRPGATYSKRSVKGFSVRALPAGCIFGTKGPAVISLSDVPPSCLIGWLNSRLIRSLVHLQANAFEFNTGIVKRLPWNSDERILKLESLTLEAINACRDAAATNEVNSCFVSPCVGASFMEGHSKTLAVIERGERVRDACCSQWDKVVDDVYGVDSSSMLFDCPDEDEQSNEDVDDEQPCLVSEEHVEQMLSYAVGSVVGRWDIRYATGDREPPELPDPFDPLPVCPPGMLQGPDGLPAKPEDVPSDYPVRIDWDGILVDDAEHEDDIVRRVRDVLEVIWKDRAEAIEKEACEILGVRELRDYFRKPGNGGFWMDHVKRYSKSRRKAPIYWYLRSGKGNYGLWLYYHRLDKDILFKALLNYVEPKIRLKEDRLKSLRGRKEAVGSSGREAKKIEKQMDRQEQFVSELRDFADKLRRAADLHLEPDLNDGVILNIAPLWELVPWKEAKKYWEALQEGKYDWSHIALQLWPDRVKEKCRTDRSIAIAHGREDLCELPSQSAAKKTRGGRRRRS